MEVHKKNKIKNGRKKVMKVLIRIERIIGI